MNSVARRLSEYGLWAVAWVFYLTVGYVFYEAILNFMSILRACS